MGNKKIEFLIKCATDTANFIFSIKLHKNLKSKRFKGDGWLINLMFYFTK